MLPTISNLASTIDIVTSPNNSNIIALGFAILAEPDVTSKGLELLLLLLFVLNLISLLF
jgi:hypothetical protein